MISDATLAYATDYSPGAVGDDSLVRLVAMGIPKRYVQPCAKGDPASLYQSGSLRQRANLMLGDEEDNRLLCRSWSLTDGQEYWFGQWWFNSQCSLLCLPQTLQTVGKKRLIRQNDWQKTLSALVKSRPQRPLDALIITLSLETLHDDDTVRASLLHNCQQLQQVCTESANLPDHQRHGITGRYSRSAGAIAGRCSPQSDWQHDSGRQRSHLETAVDRQCAGQYPDFAAAVHR